MPEEPPDNPGDRREMGQYLALAQVGAEMVAPLCLGLWLDYQFGWSPWATVSGAILGFVGGMIHLITMAQRMNQKGPSNKKNGT